MKPCDRAAESGTLAYPGEVQGMRFAQVIEAALREDDAGLADETSVATSASVHASPAGRDSWLTRPNPAA